MLKRLIIFVFVFLVLIVITATSASAQVVVNEVMPNPAGSDSANEWLELYNTSVLNIDLNGYILKDALGATLIIDMDHVDSSTQIGGNGFLIVRRNGNTTFSLNNDQDTINLYKTDSVTLEDSFAYTGSTEEKTWGRIPDGSTIFSDILNPTPGQSNQGSTPTPTPTPTPIPTPTPTSTPIIQAIVNIGDAKDEDGQILSSVKIYIDGTYTNHYAPEVLIFCDGCSCNSASCGFGTHVFKFEKSGFETYEISRDIVAGETTQINPVLEKESVSSATPTPTPAVTTPTPSSTKSAFAVLASTFFNPHALY